MTLLIILIVSFIMNFFLVKSSFINNDITYNINGFTTRYIVIDRLMHNDFGCYLLFLKTPFIFFSELILVKKTCMVQKVGHWGSLSCCYILPGPLILLHQSLLIRQIGVGTEKAFYRAATYSPSHCFIQDWIAFIPDCFRTPNACGKRSELTKYGIIIKEVNNTTWLALFIWY